MAARTDIEHLLSPVTIGDIPLKNRIVMAPMTRSRAGAGSVPNELMAQYYNQRAGAGLIVTEGTSPSPNGVGYPRIPGIWSVEQVAGWKIVTGAVHARDARIFLQLMHTGRIGHPLNLPPGAEVLAPSAVAAAGEMYTDAKGPQPHAVPRAMTEDDIARAREEYVTAAKNAIAAGFDGVELHAANGYLLEQFLSPQTNRRTDRWGGSVENRLRFVVDVARSVAEAIGGGRVGIRLSPYGVNADMHPYPEIDETYRTLVPILGQVGVHYVHIVDHSSMGAPEVPEPLKLALRKEFPRTFILSGGFNARTAEAALREGRGDLVAFGRPFISNPDFVSRIEKGIALADPDFNTFYTPGPAGYTDYPPAG